MRLTILNQFYAPDISPTAQIAASLAEHRAGQGDVVTVLAGRAGYVEGAAPTGLSASREAVHVRRVWTPDLGKSSVPRRLVGYLSFLAGAAGRVLLLPRQDVIVAMTTPPLVVAIALLHKLLHPSTKVILWSMDCYPDAAERFGKLRPGGAVSRALRRLNRFVFRRLHHVIALDGAMATLLFSQYAAGPERPSVSVVPNWERQDRFPAGAEVAPWAGYEELGIDGRTVVVYTGNAGVGHRFETVLEAAALVQHEVVFVFIGGGARRAELEQAAAERNLGNLMFRGYVSEAEAQGVMAGADGALITLDDRSLGLMSPSKLHANLAAGLPVVYVGPAGSNVDEAIHRFGCGTSLRGGDVEGLVAAVRRLREDPAARTRARTAFDQAYNDAVALPQIDRIVDGP
ncbi:MAG: glycosyltransferase family 4 protein [Acidimicrobiales bacterium]|nr:glycosyltransferase family 4 protein [Acidimicrobiales bacterium]